jgi:predicted SpoU family rRNA methylase
MNAYSLQELQTAATVSRVQNFSAGGKIAVANESMARAMGYKTIFLSHSHKDREYALGLKAIIERQGGSLYIDWLDEEMPPVTSRETAERLRVKIVHCFLFMFWRRRTQ